MKNTLDLSDKLSKILMIHIRYDCCLLCDELFQVNFPVITDVYAGFILPECPYCMRMVKAENLTYVQDEARKEWGLAPLTARQKFELRILRGQLPSFTGINSWE